MTDDGVVEVEVVDFEAEDGRVEDDVADLDVVVMCANALLQGRARMGHRGFRGRGRIGTGAHDLRGRDRDSQGEEEGEGKDGVHFVCFVCASLVENEVWPRKVEMVDFGESF